MWKINPFKYTKRPSDEILVGNIHLGGNNPVRVQSMANTDTNNIEDSVNQCLKIVEAGGEIVRFTTQGTREAESIHLIHEELRKKGCLTPLVADIHFNANAADAAARYVEKVRINPGNYVGSIKTSDSGTDYTDEEFMLEFEKIKSRFIPFLNICKEHNTAIRIGVNHGSLSERMMNRFGDTSLGMVESCMEFLRICKEQNFNNVVISMKTSNTVMMVQTVRLLADRMEEENLHFPLHLGVTEAGDGEDGRIKSSVGIGALLIDGIGDTVRVSLSEDPEFEIPVAKLLVNHIAGINQAPEVKGQVYENHSIYEYKRRKTRKVSNIGGDCVPVVFSSKEGNYSSNPDYIIKEDVIFSYNSTPFAIYTSDYINTIKEDDSEIKFLKIKYSDLSGEVLELLKTDKNLVVLLESVHANKTAEFRAFFHKLMIENCDVPVIICQNYEENDLQSLQIKAAAETGILFIDGFGDGLYIENRGVITAEELNSVTFGILQAARVRITKTEFVSCPGCGRTMFNLQTVIAKIKARTSHLKGLKIGIMGCIVNGPGEMADADYGYVGAGKGKISLYKKKICLERNIPEDEAVDKLIQLIKENGDWHD